MPALEMKRPALERAWRRCSPLAALEFLGFRQQMQLWLPVLAASALLALSFLWLDTRHASDNARWTQWLGDALTHSQRLAKAAPAALAGRPDGLRELAESRDIVERSLRLLSSEGVSARVAGRERSANALLGAWRPSDAAAAVLLAQPSQRLRQGDADSDAPERSGTQEPAVPPLRSGTPAPAAPAEWAGTPEPAGAMQRIAAEHRIAQDSEPMRLQLESLRDALPESAGLLSRNGTSAAIASLVALLALCALFRAFLADSERRAREARGQQADAERLEAETRQANERNQVAIRRLMTELQKVADGDLTVQASVSEDITGAIARSVNYSVEELRNLVSQINATARMVNEASSRAQMTAAGLQAASEQQSREIRETGEAVLRMARQINEVSAQAAGSVQVARMSLSASQEGSQAVNNAISGMEGIRGQIQETAKRIKRLGESSQEIGEIVELISDITEQTNVLALNAAIQAASAGEAGRGFTVVAEEVQRLAERSARATRQIAALIRTIQADTRDAVAAMERSTQGVVSGTKLSDEAGRALGEIGRVSHRLAELIEDFSRTTSKQAASAGTVAQSIQRILLVTEQTSEGTLQTTGSIRQLSGLAQQLKRSVSRFKVA